MVGVVENKMSYYILYLSFFLSISFIVLDTSKKLSYSFWKDFPFKIFFLSNKK